MFRYILATIFILAFILPGLLQSFPELNHSKTMSYLIAPLMFMGLLAQLYIMNRMRKREREAIKTESPHVSEIKDS